MTKLHMILFGSAALVLAGCAQNPKQPPQAKAGHEVQVVDVVAYPGQPMVPTGETVVIVPDPSQPGYNDPYVQRRVDRAEAKGEYKARKKAARQEYKEDKAQADAELRAAQPVHGSERNVDGYANRPGSSGK